MKKVIYFLVFTAFALAAVVGYFLIKNRVGKKDKNMPITDNTTSNSNTGNGGTTTVETLQLTTPFRSANRLTIQTLQAELNREVLRHLQSSAIIQPIAKDGIWGAQTDRAVRFIYAIAALQDIEDIDWDVSQHTLNNIRQVLPQAKQVLQFP